MTEKEPSTTDQPQDAQATPSSTAASAPEPAGAATPAGKSRSSFPLTASLALLLALAAGGGVGYLWIQQQAQQASVDKLEGFGLDLRARADELQRLAGQIDTLDQRHSERLSEFSAELQGQRRQLDELPLRVGRLENALENVPGVADKARSAWLLAEAEYFLRIANAQLALARNPDVALRALQLADEKLRDIGDPGLTPVRSALADEMTALRAVPRPDTEGIVLSLGSLAASLDRLPFAQQNPDRFGHDSSRSDDGLSGWQRAWQAIKEALMGLVRVKRTDEPVTPLRSEAEESLLLRGMATELELARLALIRGEAALYRDAIASVSTSLQRYFDTSSPQVQAAQSQLDQLASAVLPDALPDISGSLRLLDRLADGTAAP